MLHLQRFGALCCLIWFFLVLFRFAELSCAQTQARMFIFQRRYLSHKCPSRKAFVVGYVGVLVGKLLFDDAFFEIVLGVEQQGYP